MTEWLGRGEAPGRFSLDDEAEVQGTDATKSLIRYSRMPVGSATELRRHLESGKRLKLLETQAEDDAVREDDPRLAFETDMRLMTGLLREVLADLGRELGMRGPAISVAA